MCLINLIKEKISKITSLFNCCCDKNSCEKKKTEEEIKEKIEIVNSDIKEVKNEFLEKKPEIDPKLELEKLRKELAEEFNVQEHMIFSNKLLEDLLIEKPKSTKSLLLIKGFGPVKVEKYGEKIVAIFK